MGREDDARSSSSRIFSWAILIAILAVLLVVGYLIIDTLMQIRRPMVDIPNAAGTQFQELINPTPTIYADPVTVIRSVQALSRLETAAYTIEKVITAESGQGAFGFLFGDRLLLVAQGQVIAGVDLSRISEEDIQIAGGAIWITVPASEIFVATLNNDATYVYDRETGVLAEQQINLETQARQEAERQILLAALEDGILDMAQDNARLYLEGLLQALGFDEVHYVTATPGPDQDRGSNATP